MSDNLEKRLKELDLNRDDLNPVLTKDSNYCLLLHQEKLSVYHRLEKHYINVDFLSKQLNYRSQSHIFSELIVKAVLGKKKQALNILDCTAGFGKDAYILSLADCKITANESNILMYALLKDGLKRAHITSIHLSNIDSFDVVNTNQCEVIYLDPMYPSSNKSAKNNKYMTFLQQFVGHQQDTAEQLFIKALASSAKKIVIKRPPKAEFINQHKPTSQIIGKSARFDIYVI